MDCNLAATTASACASSCPAICEVSWDKKFCWKLAARWWNNRAVPRSILWRVSRLSMSSRIDSKAAEPEAPMELAAAEPAASSKWARLRSLSTNWLMASPRSSSSSLSANGSRAGGATGKAGRLLPLEEPTPWATAGGPRAAMGKTRHLQRPQADWGSNGACALYCNQGAHCGTPPQEPATEKHQMASNNSNLAKIIGLAPNLLRIDMLMILFMLLN